MANRKKDSEDAEMRMAPPATDPEARENQLIFLAEKQAEKMLREGRAPTQLVIHYVRQATVKAELEKEKLRRENILLEAKASAIESAARSEELYARAIAAMREYSGSLAQDY